MTPQTSPRRALAPWAARPALLALAVLAAPLTTRAQQAPAASAPSAAPTGLVAFVDVTVVPMDRDRVLEHHTVVVRGGQVAEMGPTSRVRVPAGATRVDGHGKYLMPGLVESHSHLSQGQGAMSDGLGRQFALWLANGITTVRGLVAPPGIVAVRDRVNRGEILAPTLYVAGPSINGQSAPSPEAARRLVESAKAGGYDLLKTHGGLSRATYDTMVAAARQTGMRLSGHVTPGYGLLRALEAGQQVEHLDGYIAALLPDAVAATTSQVIVEPEVLAQVDESKIPELAQMTKRAGVWNGMTLALFRIVAGPTPAESLAALPEMRYVAPAQLAQWAAQKRAAFGEMPPDGAARYIALRDRIARSLYQAGCKLLASSDSPQFFLVTGFGFHRELRAMAAAGLPPYAVLEAATRNPAEWLGRAADFGTVATGQRADLLLLDANPLADVGNTERVAGVMVRGRWISRAELDGMLAEVERAVKQ